ncbi:MULTISPECIES: lipoyl(octanoyl) transferase LipB [Rothia]|uniref:Octanoyltransferase n=1 Tax=Rothia nasimurium TaxID=85336 RepID=A0A1Y1RPN9_9MICC|nr:lipoate--protein ligase B [Rothia nasimurium]
MALLFNRLGFAPNYVEYTEALEIQRALHEDVANRTRQNTVLLLEHREVITAGKRTEKHEYPSDNSVPVITIDRGGKLTWHGPGQLVGYPIVQLPEPIDVVKYVRVLEEILINVLTDLGITCQRVEGRSGVWVVGDGALVQDKKIAAIGIRVAKNTTMHGFSLNCNNPTDPFGAFIPCGITDAGVTTISEQLGRNISPADVVDRIEDELSRYADQLAANFTVKA